MPALLTTLLAASAAAAPAPLHLDALLEEVARGAPALRARQAAVDVARARVGVAGAWEDPTLAVMTEDVPLPGAAAPSPMLTYRFTQPLGTLWTRGAAKDAARAAVEQAQARSSRSEWNARAAATRAFYELWMNHQMADIVSRQIRAVQRMRGSALARYEGGMQMVHHDLLRAEAEIATMEAELAALRAERQAMVAMLNALRGLPQAAPIGAPVPPDRAPLPDLETLAARVEAAPEVQAARAMRAEAAARTRLARRMYLPMPMVGAFYQHRPGEMPDSFGAEVAVSIPLFWFDRQDNELAMARAMEREAERDQEAMRAMTEAELRLAHSRAAAAQAAVEALEATALPRLRATVESAEATYRAGGQTFLELLEAILALQRVEGDLVRHLANRGIAMAEVARLLAARPMEESR